MGAHTEHRGGHDDHSHDHEHGDSGSHSTLKGYVTGFVLAVILTVIPFWLVMGKVFANPNLTAMVILGIAAVQIVVHMVYFLHMNSKLEGGWSLLALIFTLMLLVIMLAGSIWVMYHLNANMMPVSAHDMKNMP
nr:cytochrome o ubiquinol oxidase subunit IV [uncultured Albidiferax sp.]